MEEVWASHTQCTAGPRTSPSKLRNRQQNMKSFNIQLPVVSKLYVCFYYYSMMTDLREAVGDSSQVLRSICFSSFLWMLNKQCHGCELYSYPPFLGPFLSHSCLLHMTAEIYWTVDTRPPEVTDQGICCRMSLYQAIFIIWNFQVSCWSTSYSCDKSGEHKQMISPLGCYRNWERLKGEYSLYCEALMTDSWRVQPA